MSNKIKFINTNIIQMIYFQANKNIKYFFFKYGKIKRKIIERHFNMLFLIINMFLYFLVLCCNEHIITKLLCLQDVT